MFEPMRTNTSIRKKLKVEDEWLEIFIRKQKLKYFSHLKRSEDLGKIILEGKIDGKRERGRRTRQWERDIRNVFDNRGLWG